MFNLDGSEGKMCGNGIRCVAKFMRDNGIVDKDEMTIETLSGIMTVSLIRHYGEVSGATVNMGKAILAPHLVPVELEPDENGRVVDRKVNIAGNDYNITCVSMGNPHAVVFMNNVDSLDIDKVGPEFEHDKIFPERVNAEFIKVIDDHTLKMRVWREAPARLGLAAPVLVQQQLRLFLTDSAKRTRKYLLYLREALLR